MLLQEICMWLGSSSISMLVPISFSVVVSYNDSS